VVEAATDFSVSLVRHTLENTNLGNKAVGQFVNLETDLLAKYVQKLLASQKAGEATNVEKLFKAGFLS